MQSKPSKKLSSSCNKSTSWDPVAKSYHNLVQTKGHYYHKEVILPKLLSALSLTSESSIFDLGCGQGIFERAIPKTCNYLGVDISPNLITIAKKLRKSKSHQFLIHDANQPLQNYTSSFSHAVAILSLQNMRTPEQAIQNAAAYLTPLGQFFMILNHPCFRIPRASFWHYIEDKKLMTRQIERYLSPMIIPISANPGKKQSASTLSFHFPLSFWTKALTSNGFAIHNIDEWISPKRSTGKRAKAENLCRQEFPLFLMISSIKIK
ncbi:class I SAM-dependent methyltransferase [Chlamydia sp. 17-3921]|uniref:class I SAM-dependent methyltransferase n=1 Tax=Chlamydia sp. 17-3921 TaxID=2675798 RepID=UPI001917C3F4|nr:class I SAM-dependent methyltransferase [Chlamydia sp. 17-3921]